MTKTAKIKINICSAIKGHPARIGNNTITIPAVVNADIMNKNRCRKNLRICSDVSIGLYNICKTKNVIVTAIAEMLKAHHNPNLSCRTFGKAYTMITVTTI